MRWLLALYPAWWRRRYGEEFLALLEGQRANPRLVLDVFRGALDARLRLCREQPIRPAFACSFCGKDRWAVRRLIAGPNCVYICDECIALCNSILAQDPPPAPSAAAARQGQARCRPRPSWRRILVHRRRIVHQHG